ncbi:MAG: glycosyltransferase family 2 protein [Bacteroidales bacterium]|nr:glycosyltransferase family 2 protein [Bacteroidales bacterium]
MEEELVSVIVPVYNVENWLPRCLECIEAQTYKNLEIILVDDGSTDGSGRLCDGFAAKDPRARVIHHPTNIGLWAARNTGQDAATGEYLWFPDGDDYFHKDIIRIMHEAINRMDPDAKSLYKMVVVGYKTTDRLDEDVQYEVRRVSPKVMTNSDLYYNWVTRLPIGLMSFMWNKLYRRDLVRDVRTGNYRYSQDRDFNIKVCRKRTNAIYLDNELYYWVQRSTSAMHTTDYYYDRAKMEISYDYDNMKKDDVRHRFYYLTSIYYTIAVVLDKAYEKNDLKKVSNSYKALVHETWKDYVFKKNELVPFKKRLKLCLRSRFPMVYYGIIKR